MFRKLTAVFLILFMVQLGCYNTYNVSLDEFKKAAEGGQNNAVEIKTEDGQTIVVTENTKLGLTDKTGAYYAVSPFNFTMSANQIIAPDEDLIIGRSEIETGNVKLVSGSKTAMLVAGGLAAVVGGALFVTLTAEEERGFGE